MIGADLFSSHAPLLISKSFRRDTTRIMQSSVRHDPGSGISDGEDRFDMSVFGKSMPVLIDDDLVSYHVPLFISKSFRRDTIRTMLSSVGNDPGSGIADDDDRIDESGFRKSTPMRTRLRILKNLDAVSDPTRQLYLWLRYFPFMDWFPPPDSWRGMIASHVDSLFQDWFTVHWFVTRYEATICKRWRAKTVEQRRKIILDAWPDMALNHRPDHDILFNSPEAAEHFGDNPINIYAHFNSKTCKLPYMNQEDLVQPRTFLTLLNSRARNMPHTFAHAELIHSPLGAWKEETLWKNLQGYTVSFTGQIDVGYGKVLPWVNKQDAVDYVRKGRAMHPGSAMQVLQIQCAIWEFLESCCRKIMHEVDEDTLISAPIMPEPPPLSDQDLNYKSIGDTAMEEPYRAPPRTDFSRLKALISARIGDLEDHVWALREDPGYFAETFQSYREHEPKYARATNGQKHFLAHRQPEAIMTYFVRDILLDGYYLLYNWHECYRLLVDFEKMTQEHSPAIECGQGLPDKFTKAIKQLWNLFLSILTDVHANFRRGLMVSPPLRHLFQKHPGDPMDMDLSMSLNVAEVEKDPTAKDLVRIVNAIIMQNDPPYDGYDLYLDELDRHMKRDPDLKNLISPWVGYFLSQMSVTSEGIHQLRLFRPWVAEVEHDLSKHTFSPDTLTAPAMRDGSDHFMALTQRWSGIMGPCLDDYALVRLADPSDGKFDFPVSERRTRTSVKRMQAAEANLDRFWKRADAYCKKRTGKTFPELFDKDITNGRTIQRTPNWVDPPKFKKGKKDESNERTPQVEYIYQPFSLLDHDASREVTGTFDKLSLSTKDKIKTRGSAAIPDTQTPIIDHQDPATPAPHPVFQVDKRSFKVFKALFHSPLSPDIPGEVPWTDFIHAMASTGFSVEKLHGSAWQFTPKTLDVERSIQFHEPHPASKLPFIWARRFGRRLHRAYGWTGDMFRMA